jgi:hypothetical protein
VEIVYISRGTTWNDKGQCKLALPRLDLPISRTGLLVYHPPLFKVTPEPGSFRLEAYQEPTSRALRPAPPAKIVASIGAGALSPLTPPPPPNLAVSATTDSKTEVRQVSTETLVDNFRLTLEGGKAAGILPIKVRFAGLGPSLYLVSELTAENQSPGTDLNYQRERKAGGR